MHINITHMSHVKKLKMYNIQFKVLKAIQIYTRPINVYKKQVMVNQNLDEITQIFNSYIRNTIIKIVLI